MVDFTLTDEEKALRELAHDFAAKELRPVAWDYDRDGRWPQEIIEKAHEIGLMNVHVADEYGGPGLSYLDGCVIEEGSPGAARASSATRSTSRAGAWTRTLT